MIKRKQKSFEELTITDDFMFGAVMRDPDNLKPLLEYILKVPVTRLKYPELQKVIDLTYDAKGIRLDVYCEDEKETVYSVEIQVANRSSLPKRIRYYHSMIDLNIVNKGDDYRKLRKSYVIFICCFDPFGQNRYVYTFEQQCQEVPSLYLADEAHSIVLNVKGTSGEISEELKAALQYMAGQTPADGYAKTLDDAVKRVKNNEKWRAEYMTLYNKIQETANMAALTQSVYSLKILRNSLDKTELAKAFNMSVEKLMKILDFIDKNPDMPDEQIAESFYDD